MLVEEMKRENVHMGKGKWKGMGNRREEKKGKKVT